MSNPDSVWELHEIEGKNSSNTDVYEVIEDYSMWPYPFHASVRVAVRYIEKNMLKSSPGRQVGFDAELELLYQLPPDSMVDYYPANHVRNMRELKALCANHKRLKDKKGLPK